MKKNVIITTVIVVLMAIIAVVAVVLLINNRSDGNNSGDNERNGNITSFSFSRSYGLGGAVGYTITLKDGKKSSLKYEYYGYDSNEDNNFEKDIDAKYLDELADIIKEKKVVKWDGFDESKDGVLDGSGFSLKVKYDDGKEINAYGYMKYPDNYQEVMESFDKVLENAKNSNLSN